MPTVYALSFNSIGFLDQCLAKEGQRIGVLAVLAQIAWDCLETLDCLGHLVKGRSSLHCHHKLQFSPMVWHFKPGVKTRSVSAPKM